MLHKITLIITDFTLVIGLALYFRKESQIEAKYCSFVLVLFNGGLLIIDHLHFQYNGMLIGLLLISIGLLKKEMYISASFAFAVLILTKHLFLNLAPLYFVYLLRKYCLTTNTPCPKDCSLKQAGRFLQLAMVVLWTVGLALFSICCGQQISILSQTKQILSRLFPFGRGLVHTYWAGNIWALYLAFDRTLLLLSKRLDLLNSGHLISSTTGGREDGKLMAVLPSISPSFSALLFAIAIVPCLRNIWVEPRIERFVHSAVFVGLSSFMVGFHVHEKAMLSVAVPLALVAFGDQQSRHLYKVLNSGMVLSFLPLLPHTNQCLERFIFLLTSNAITFRALRGALSSKKDCLVERGFVCSSSLVLLFYELFPLLFGTEEVAGDETKSWKVKMEFLPLMVVSLHTSLAYTYCWFVSFKIVA
mmetsp:Transcript_5207/g.7828  ORF Transcript_5207/g.7828 Transcript_5207/m.7828 type:complete len:417 (+) Transcript_5207:457-1707(+)